MDIQIKEIQSSQVHSTWLRRIIIKYQNSENSKSSKGKVSSHCKGISHYQQIPQQKPCTLEKNGMTCIQSAKEKNTARILHLTKPYFKNEGDRVFSRQANTKGIHQHQNSLIRNAYKSAWTKSKRIVLWRSK